LEYVKFAGGLRKYYNTILGAFESSPPVILEQKSVAAADSLLSRSIASLPTARQMPPDRHSPPLSLPFTFNETGQNEAGMKPSLAISSSSSLTKEEKAAEMARKKDERKQVRVVASFFYNVH
jgi:hypothetical protein